MSSLYPLTPIVGSSRKRGRTDVFEPSSPIEYSDEDPAQHSAQTSKKKTKHQSSFLSSPSSSFLLPSFVHKPVDDSKSIFLPAEDHDDACIGDLKRTPIYRFSPAGPCSRNPFAAYGTKGKGYGPSSRVSSRSKPLTSPIITGSNKCSDWEAKPKLPTETQQEKVSPGKASFSKGFTLIEVSDSEEPESPHAGFPKREDFLENSEPFGTPDTRKNVHFSSASLPNDETGNTNSGSRLTWSWEDLDDQVLKNLKSTKATPLIRQLAGSLFGPHLKPAEGQEINSRTIDITCDSTEAHIRRCNAWKASKPTNEKIEFVGDSLWRDIQSGKSGYGAAIVDGVEFRAGDYVITRPPNCPTTRSRKGKTNDINRQSDNGASFALRGIGSQDLLWFGRISYLFENELLEKCFHIRWFHHGFDTMIREFSGPNELFLSSLCDDNPLQCINGKIQVDFVDHAREDPDSSVIETKFTAMNHFFYRFHYDSDKKLFSDARSQEPQDSIRRDYRPPVYHCDCCILKSEEDRKHQIKIISTSADGSVTGIEFEGIKYYLDDFIYMVHGVGTLAQIGQILGIRVLNCASTHSTYMDEVNVKIKVRGFDRIEDRHEGWHLSVLEEKKQTPRDERLLSLSDKTYFTCPSGLDGKCHVQHIAQVRDLDTYKDAVGTFYVADKLLRYKDRNTGPQSELLVPRDIQCSQATQEEVRLAMLKQEAFFDRGQKARGLELFAGIGGMSTGLRMSGAVEIAWAIEFAPAAAATFKRNSPNTSVYNEDANNCLARAMRQDIGSSADHEEKDILDRPVQAMPRCGEVDIIIAGFPCKGYTKANRRPKADDLKNTLVLLVLSYVDFYRPPYVLLENVKALLHHKLGAEQTNRYKVEGGIKQGSMKFILRALTCLGYQVQYCVMEAGHFGIPQSRQRLIIWAARAGHKLPNFPKPITTFSRTSPSSWHRTRRSAPHSEVTVADLVTDLPAFEWENPHNIIKATPQHIHERLERATKIDQYKVRPGQDFVGQNRQNYSSKPLNEFQRRLRRGLKDGYLMNHVTPSWYDDPSRVGFNRRLRSARTEQVCNVPLRPGADHRDLPDELKSWGNYHPDSAASKNKFYPGRMGRLQLDKPFTACLTTVDPSGAGSQLLHPNQHRIVSLREYARVQGFSDTFVFDMSKHIKLAYRGIGNSVPVPLAEAIGKELLQVLIDRFWEEELEKTRTRASRLKHKGTGTKDDAIILD